MSTNLHTTYSDFLRAMRALANPYSTSMPKFERACEAIWYEGILGGNKLSAAAGCSKPTAIKWSNCARQLGYRENQVRPRSQAHEKEASKHQERTAKMTLEERRAYYSGLLDASIEDNKTNPTELTKLIAQQTSLVPGLKAPETRLDVQILIGRDNTDRIEEGLAENLKWIMGNDRDFGLRLLGKAGLDTKSLLSQIPAAEDVTDAEITEMDDGPSSGRPTTGSPDDGGDRNVPGGS